ncbi:MAG TPA: hypothetical protein VMT15_00165 [Bryobacteraceae bacterium]|nr:hypothetical protein [Bryobacteraceae bacterium]
MLVKLHTVESAIAGLMPLILVLGAARAAVPVIGTVAARGSFVLDRATVTGNATLFEGATVETKAASSRMDLASGAKVLLAAESRARLYSDHLVLERGEGQWEKAATYHFEARGLTIQPETGNASARVALAGGARVELAVFSGSFRVLNAKGMLVANAAAGRSLELEPQMPDASTKLTGTLRLSSGHYLLTDETTNVTVELTGAGLSQDVGYRVEVTGTTDVAATPVSDAAHLVRVSSAKRLGKSRDSGGAAAAGKGGAPGGAASSGVGISATAVAIIGGVAAAATVGGLAAAGKLPGQGAPSPTPISR